MTMVRTTWDTIYAHHKRTGKKWASLGDPIHDSFFSFIKHTKFAAKSALDLGCGNGKHLKFLQDVGFRVAGVDSSPTAIRLARKMLGKKADLRTADIYTRPIPQKKYDLILSVATIQHAKKETIKKIINRIYNSLPINGRVFITFPRTNSLRRWATFKESKRIAPGTYVPLLGPEKGLVHSFFEKDELKKLFSRFKRTRIIGDDMGRWIVRGERGAPK
jgi:SAM-dependent methyltransferase